MRKRPCFLCALTFPVLLLHVPKTEAKAFIRFLRTLYNIITSKFPSVVIAAGVRPFNFHCLRHYYASVMLFLNIPNKYTQQRMGHATDNMLKNVYQHLMAEKVHEADAMSDAFFEDVNTKSEHEK